MNIELTEGVGKHARRIASELECRGVYLCSCRIGCILNGCLLFMDIILAEVREGRCLPRLPPFRPKQSVYLEKQGYLDGKCEKLC